MPRARKSSFFIHFSGFITNTASYSIVIIVAQKLNLTNTKPRTPNTVGWFSAYDGNIIGGTLLGVGLGLTGACPGTVIPQVVTGVPSSPLVLAGGLLGGIVYSKLGSPLQQKVTDIKPLSTPTVYQQFGVSRQWGILIFETFALGVVALSNHFYPDNRNLFVSAITGGLLVGLSQGLNLFLTGNTLGSSGAFEQLGDVFWHFEKSIFEPSKRTSMPAYQKTVAFTAGAAAGSFVIKTVFDLPPPVAVAISPLRALVGGTIMIFGARIGGGCTSGHGISGMSQLSISSIITVAAMFGGGILVTAVL